MSSKSCIYCFNFCVLIFVASIVFFPTIVLFAQETNTKLNGYVNPFIGTGTFDSISLPGATYPGATTPFGMVQLSPDTKYTPRYVASGYDYRDSIIYGFSHTHLSGTGPPDLFDVLIMPASGDLEILDSMQLGYQSRFSHNQEMAKPGYYQVKLLNYNINAELTASEHVGFHRYTFPQSTQSHILIDLNHTFKSNERRNRLSTKMLAQIKVVNNRTIEGFRIIRGWCQGLRKVYFRAEFSKAFDGNVMINNKKLFENQSLINENEIKILLSFNTTDNEKILIKVGLSAVSIENARLNLSTEVPDWNFDQIVDNASKQWEKELGCIVVEGTKEQKEIFYTALYHAFIQPNNIADVNGDYPATDMAVRNAPDKKHYTTFSLWDTYRAVHPLYTLTQTNRTANFVNSMIRQYDTYGFLPIWQLWGLENYCMVGNHAIPVIVDAALKDIKGIDLQKAYEAVRASSTVEHFNAPFAEWEKYGYMPVDLIGQSVSITLEMAFDDWCVAQLAKKLGKVDDYEHFMKRSEFYRNLYDSKSNFFRPKNKNGNWLEPFNPLAYGANLVSPYTEGNAWQYLFYAPHDMAGLINLFGGNKGFSLKLDTFFTLKLPSIKLNDNVSGMIGQYAHGNEPSHHAAYLYNYCGQAWKTQKLVSQIQNELYNNTIKGFSGNEDCGQMSAWYVFSSMGFYPVNPASGVYVIGSPGLASAIIKLDNGKTFIVKAKNTSKDNAYIQSATLNGKPYTKSYITHSDIMNGGTLEFIMGKQPYMKWGSGLQDIPPSSTY